MGVVTELNGRQREAVEHGNGPLLVLAGAGSGKTRVITARIARLVGAGTPSSAILALTFTNKAAAEMRGRLDTTLGARAADLWISTFHSAAAQILRRHIQRLGYTRDFSIYDDQDRARLIRRCMLEENISEQAVAPAVIAWAIDQAKNEALTPAELAAGPWQERTELPAGSRTAFAARARGLFSETAARVYRRYQAALERQNAVDFGDLILLVVRLFREHSDVLTRYQHRLCHLLVDEYQDTNHAQYLLLRLLAAAERPNLCVVGDEDQSIYGWRGAELRNILDFEHDYPEVRVIRLEQNYRSTKTILAAAGAVIANNLDRKGKRLWTTNASGDPVTVAVAEDDLAEARLVMTEVRHLVAAGHTLGEVVVFYRTNAQSRAIEEAAMKAALPYAIVGGIRFYERKEIKDLLAYLRVLANPADDSSLERVINCPPRGIGEQTLAALRTAARQAGTSIRAVLATPQPYGSTLASTATPGLGLGAGAAARVQAFAELLARIEQALDGDSLAAVLQAVLRETAYCDRLEAGGSERASRLEDIEELLGVARDFDLHAPATEPARARLGRFLEEAALLSDWDRQEPSRDRLTLMTLHTAKGLEFPVVFILGMEEGIFPHQRALDDPRALEEERRVCYVGMTRARMRLYLLRAQRRLRFGAVTERPPSRFLDEIPAGLVRMLALPAPRVERAPAWVSGRVPSGPVIDYSYSQVCEESDDGKLVAGTRVRHPAFGVGVVRRSEGRGEAEKVSVQFARGGTKKLMRRYANLEIVAG
jgi:DNA helicase-2/ATP-dependent DNA helicase PcrA